VVKNPQTPMFSMEDTIKLITILLKISRDLQFEVTIEENTIHDLEFAKTLQRLKREIKFSTKLEDFVTIIEYVNV
jgi:uncharacterized protein YihD (DUF1040 family)